MRRQPRRGPPRAGPRAHGGEELDVAATHPRPAQKPQRSRGGEQHHEKNRPRPQRRGHDRRRARPVESAQHRHDKARCGDGRGAPVGNRPRPQVRPPGNGQRDRKNQQGRALYGRSKHLVPLSPAQKGTCLRCARICQKRARPLGALSRGRRAPEPHGRQRGDRTHTRRGASAPVLVALSWGYARAYGRRRIRVRFAGGVNQPAKGVYWPVIPARAPREERMSERPAPRRKPAPRGAAAPRHRGHSHLPHPAPLV